MRERNLQLLVVVIKTGGGREAGACRDKHCVCILDPGAGFLQVIPQQSREIDGRSGGGGWVLKNLGQGLIAGRAGEHLAIEEVIQLRVDAEDDTAEGGGRVVKQPLAHRAAMVRDNRRLPEGNPGSKVLREPEEPSGDAAEGHGGKPKLSRSIQAGHVGAGELADVLLGGLGS